TQRWASGDRFAEMLGEPNKYKGLSDYFEDCNTVLELGCGVGVAGIMLAKTHTNLSVILTDLPQCTELAQENVSYNSLDDRVMVNAYTWGDPVHQYAFNPPGLILGTDVLYDPHLFDKFLSCLEAFARLRPIDGVKVAIAYQERSDDDRRFVEDVLMPKLNPLTVIKYKGSSGDTSTPCEVLLGTFRASYVQVC
ncbi:hypothetical protein FOL47_001880, partial [Perkinsus chesapeaki]